ncbi:hypothetical protein CCH79_00008560 [Gambusia affinis]|uniref:Uncharacterized protein n=1 Tax=Gambusia affinis TaxID=33528 RepID=A0A315V8L7_GAMAF|nr:hypothetical protein CCH79_00008560 [Gambusia affinis]
MSGVRRQSEGETPHRQFGAFVSFRTDKCSENVSMLTICHSYCSSILSWRMLAELHAKLETDGLTDFKLRWIEKDGQNFHKDTKKKT